MVNRKAIDRLLVLALAGLSAGCASAGGQYRPEDIPRLEQEAIAQPANAEAATRLGIAYVSARRHDDARRVLAPLVQQGTDNGAVFLYLGLANEALEDYTAARSAYEQYLQRSRNDELKEDIRGRLTLITRHELKQQARAVLAREDAISQEAPTPRTIAVLPFRFSGANEELRPLQTALADMMVTDLSVAPNSLRPLERIQIQALLDEMMLGQAGITDQATSVRTGRLLKAENLVQGAITVTGERDLRVDGDVLLTAQRSSRGTLSAQNQLDAILDMEKQLVFRIYDLVGVTLTVAERERINDNRAANLLAFLAYGRGLEALDRGNYTEAATYFNQSVQLDPQFSRAQAQRRETAQLEQANQSSTDQIASSAGAELTPVTVSGAPTMSGDNLLKQTANEVNYSPGMQLTQQGRGSEGTTQNSQTRNNGQQEARGLQGAGIEQALRATIIIRIPRPGS